MVRLAACSLLLALPFLLLAAAPPKPAPADFSLQRRAPLLGSRVVGSPDPPPPFRTRRVFEKHVFRQPLYLTSHPAHDLLFVVEQAGRIVHFPPSGKGKPALFCQVKDADAYGMTFHPDYRKNRLVYVFSNGPNSQKRRKNRILRFQTIGEPPRCDPASEKLIIEWESNGHNGGDLGFGPDGMLYITSGDGTSDSDGDVTGQDLRDLCSGVLRLDVDRPAPGKGYAIPKDNPFLHLPGARGELWCFGLRNPWRMHFGPTGDLYVGDVGQDLWEMIWLIKKGGNYGWSVMEGSHPFQPLRKKGPGPFQPPLIEHPHSESRSITGGLVYRGRKFPELKGTYLYGDYSTGKVWGLRHKGGKLTFQGDLAWTRLQIVGFGQDNDGEVYLVDYSGQIHTLERSPPVKGPGIFPRRLSESGLFTSVAGHRTHPALVPYEVNSPLWSDGADKERFIALPGLETIGFTEQGPWQFPERTVLVKTFSLDTPAGRRRIETRFLTLQAGEWFGYTYAWNDAQTDATLVESAGRERTFTVRDPKAPGGKRDLAWRFPSRVECMVCHTRAANWVLGVTTAQVNRDNVYAGQRINQLAAFDRLGLFRIGWQQHFEVLEERLRHTRALAGLALPGGTLRPVQKRYLNPPVAKLEARLTQYRNKWRGDLERKGRTTPRLPRDPDEYPRLADPADGRQPIEARARSYLHANCAHCHVWAGGGNSAIDLHMNTPRDKMMLLDVPPLHDRFGIRDARLVAPGEPKRSLLYQRLSRRGPGQMPPLASRRVDETALRLVGEWVRQVKK